MKRITRGDCERYDSKGNERLMNDDIPVNTDCRYFRGDLPCKEHKQTGVHCNDCQKYSPTKERILIIKLGAMGDVVRTTPLLRRLKKERPEAEITWLTYSPEVVPGIVDRILLLECKAIPWLLANHYDLLLNLDKDAEAIALAKLVKADVKKGFALENGKCVPSDESARHKWMTGLFDDFNQANNKSYTEEIFEICGYEFDGEEYILDIEPFGKEIHAQRPLIGLNTGCGNRWNTRLWSIENWIELARNLEKRELGIVLLGGPDEDEQNKRIAREAGVLYMGLFHIREFCSLVAEMDLVVTLVTSALHFAIGAKKKVVLLNNIFNKHEFELYGRGEILQPPLECLGCFKTEFDDKCSAHNCMDLITPAQVTKVVLRHL